MGNTEKELDSLIEKTVTQISLSQGRNGLVRKVHFLDKGRWMEFYKPDDFGDIFPFVSEATGNTESARAQYSLWKKRFFQGFPIPKHKIPLPQFFEAANVDDMLQGLNIISGSFNDDYFTAEGNSLAKVVIKKLQMKNNMFASVKVPLLGLSLPEGMSPLKPRINEFGYFANASSNGLLAASIIRLGIRSGDKELIKAGKRCVDAWLSTETYSRTGLFPQKAVPKDSEEISLAKHNTNLGYAIADLGEVDNKYKQIAVKHLGSIEGRFQRKGLYISNNGNGTDLLVATNTYLRLLFRVSRLGYEEYYKKAQDLCFQIAEKAFLKNDQRAKKEFFEDDAQGDFGNMVLVLDRDNRKQPLAEAIYLDLVTRFHLGNGLWQDYSRQDMQRTAHSKYLGGVLKFLVTYRAYLKKEDLSSTKWFLLTQDR